MLVDLLLRKHYGLNVPDSVCLLKQLSLDGVELEEIKVLRISSSTIRFLLVHNCYHNDCEVMMDTPSLKTIFYNDYAPIYYPLINFSSLLKAHIDIGPSKEQLEAEEEDETSKYGQNVSKLVAACSNVDFMYLSNSSVSASFLYSKTSVIEI
ncbi:hypothetical protein ACSBR2_020083 [Camellia fascicularis]